MKKFAGWGNPWRLPACQPFKIMGILQDDKQFHLKITPKDIGHYVLLCGDPGRVSTIAAQLDDARFVVHNREYCLYTGTLCGVAVTVCSHGIGGPSTAICAEELIRCGAHTFIRVGTSGGIRQNVMGGDLCIAMAATRDDGTSAEYLPPSYPATADFNVTLALHEAAKSICSGAPGDHVHVGVVQSKDSFYGETNPETMPVAPALLARWQAYVQLGCLTSEMECATLFAVAATRGVRAGGVLAAIWNVEREKLGLPNPTVEDTTRAISCGVQAMRLLIAQDQAAQAQ